MKKLFTLFLATLTVCVLYVNAAEEEDTTGTEQEETSVLSNPTQAQKVENLAQASIDAEALESAQSALAEAQAAYDSDPTEENAATLEAAQSALASVAGVSTDDIAAMREAGMGWGEIAHEIGVHPSILGLGHTKQMQHKERTREVKGSTNSVGNSSSSNTSKAKGSSKSAEKSNASKSNNAGGNGKGNGKDK